MRPLEMSGQVSTRRNDSLNASVSRRMISSGAHRQRKRPHKLPDRTVKELSESRAPPGETAHYTHANSPIKRHFEGISRARRGGLSPDPAVQRSGAARPPGPSAPGTPVGGSRGGELAASGWSPGGVAGQVRSRSGERGMACGARHRRRGRCQSAVARAVRAVRSSLASSGFAFSRKSFMYSSANDAARGSLTLSGSRWMPRTRNS